MVGVEGFEPPRISHLLPKQTRYQATVYTPLEAPCRKRTDDLHLTKMAFYH